MGEKNNGNQKAGRDEQKKENGSLNVVFKVDCLCDGCASRILKCVRELQGVETVKTDRNANRVTVIGSVDPTAIKDNIAKKSKKKVDVVPQLKKDDKKRKNLTKTKTRATIINKREDPKRSGPVNDGGFEGAIEMPVPRMHSKGSQNCL